MIDPLVKEIKLADPSSVARKKGDDIVITSKDRKSTKIRVENHLKKRRIRYTNEKKQDKSPGIEVLSVKGHGDLIFKSKYVGGSGGLKFEVELFRDLKNYFSGNIEEPPIRHQDVLHLMERNLGIEPTEAYKVFHVARTNTTRGLVFINKKFVVQNSDGETVSDIKIVRDKKDIMYLSLKYSPSYNVIGASIKKHFLDPTTRVDAYNYFGLNGQAMASFGKEYSAITVPPNYSKVKENLESILEQSLGHNVIMIHKKSRANGTASISVVGDKNNVSIISLTDSSYIYPKPGFSSYASIKCPAKINGKTCTIDFQFRSSQSRMEPERLIINVSRIA
jgi:hypothetical protein